MDKPYCRLCGHCHWTSEGHVWAEATAPNKALAPNKQPAPNAPNSNVARAAKWKAANQDRYRDYMAELMRANGERSLKPGRLALMAKGTSAHPPAAAPAARSWGCHKTFCELSLIVPLASSSPPINPSRPQTAGDAFGPSPFYILQPHRSSISSSAGDENRTPRELALPLMGPSQWVRWSRFQFHRKEKSDRV
jgi:hypothetical protein